MSGASIETTLELWASSWRDVKARMRPLFGDVRVASSANLFLDGLLSEERRKTGWMRAEAAGDPGPWRQQAVLGRSRWDAEALVDIVRDYVVEHLADPDAVLVIDETGFLKQGKTWLRYQPESELSSWFRQRVGSLQGRTRRIAIVAMARKLLIALWRFTETGEVPAGSALRAG